MLWFYDVNIEKLSQLELKKKASHIRIFLSTLFLIHSELLNLMAAISIYGTWKLLWHLLCIYSVGIDSKQTLTTPGKANNRGEKACLGIWDGPPQMTEVHIEMCGLKVVIYAKAFTYV